MKRQIRRSLTAVVTALAPVLVAASAHAQGPVMLIGDAADDHGPENIYAGLLQQLLSNVSNGQSGILALGVDSDSEAQKWILTVSALLLNPQAIAFVNDDTVGAISFSGYAVIFIPSDGAITEGGISAEENATLVSRASDLADFLDAGGGLFALTQGGLADAYDWLGDFAAVDDLLADSVCVKELFDDVTPTEAGGAFGITESNLDGCCWHTVFTAFPEEFAPLASANEPGCPDIDGEAAILTGFVELPDIGFDPPDETPAVGEPTAESVGDLDGNGFVDVVAVIPDEDTDVEGVIQVFLNLGNDEEGNWQGLMALEPVTVGKNPSAVTTGFFDMNDTLDLAVTNANDDTVSILLNNGDATFSGPTDFAVGDAPSGVVARNFNEDSNTDLAVTNEGDSTITILLGDGLGDFSAAEAGGPGGLGLGPVTLTSDDFDDNKCPDLSGPSNGTALGPGGVVFVLLGLGDGTFEPAALYDIGVDPTDIATGDVDGDSFPDIMASNRADNTVSILINDGTGHFEPQITVDVGFEPLSVDVAELNGDTDPDMAVVAVDAIGPAVQILVNRLDGGEVVNFDPPLAFSVDANPNTVTNGDFNEDTLIDLVTVNKDEDAEKGGSVTVLLNNPPSEAPPCQGDINGDGTVNVGDFLLLLMAFGPCPDEGDCPADLDGDGDVDIHDLLQLFFVWGICAGKGECPWDLNGDGVVDHEDIVELVQNFGECPDEGDCPWDLDLDGDVDALDLWVLILHLGECPEE